MIDRSDCCEAVDEHVFEIGVVHVESETDHRNRKLKKNKHKNNNNEEKK